MFPADRILPQNVISSKDDKVVDSAIDVLRNNKDFIVGMRFIPLSKNLIYFKTECNSYFISPSSSLSNQYNFFYDIATGRLVSIERQTADATTYYLPINSIRSSINGLDYYKGTFYSNISSLQMFEEMEATKDKHPDYPPVLQTYFKTQTRKSNPVIVRMKLKD